MSISICIIAKNEEKNISRCLSSIKKHPFEIIVVDTGSNDRTKEIAFQYTDKVYDFNWIDDFSAARNYAASKTSNDWILSLDCDEYLEDCDFSSLYSLTKKHETSIGSIQIKSHCKSSLGDAAVEIGTIYRLYNKHYYHFSGKIHEQLVALNPLICTSSFDSGLVIVHLGYNEDCDFLINKQNRNISLLQKELLTCEESLKPYLYFQLGESYRVLYQLQSEPLKNTATENALTYYKKALEYDIKPDIPYYKQLLLGYSYALFRKNEYLKAIEFIESCHESVNSNSDFIFLLASLYNNIGNYEKAILLFKKTLTLSEYYVLDPDNQLSHYMIGQIYEHLGEWNAAISSYEKCASYKDSSILIEKITYKKTHPLPISICMIGKNEEASLNACLQHLIPLNCEIIFVDTGSTDTTVQIASRYTKNIYYFEWNDNFSAARNYSVSKASNDWILVVDCDEILNNPEELYASLPAFLDSVNTRRKEVGIVTINSNYIQNQDSRFSSSQVARFFSKFFSSFHGVVHEQVLSHSAETLPRYITPFTFSHIGYFGDDLSEKKAMRNISLLLKELDEENPSPYICYQLGKSYHSLKDYTSALHYLDLGLSVDIDPTLEYVHQMVETYGYALLDSGLFQDALCLEGVYDTFCNYADFVFLMGLVYMKNGLFNEAITEFLKATTFETSLVHGVTSYMAYYNIGVIYECTNHRNEAFEYYKKCGNYIPANNRLDALR